MKNFNLRWVKIDNELEAKKAMGQIGSDNGGIALMAGKAVGRALKIENVPLRIAHILKQEMLSLGGDAAVHRNTVINEIDATDILLVGTISQFRRLSKKLLAQPFGLKDFAKSLTETIAALEPTSKRILKCRDKELVLGERTLVMGILNVTPDSFSDGGRFNTLDKALQQAEALVEQGADILDLGAESTRLNHNPITPEEEWGRMENVLKELVKRIPIPISVDTWKSCSS